MVPYTYLIGWKEHNIYYYGVRYAKNCNPNDLWNPYKTSSKHVKKFIELNGDPDIIEVRKTFNDINSARLWENKVLKKMKVIERQDFLNKTDNFSIEPQIISEEHKNKLKFIMTGKKNNKLSIINKQKIGSKNPFFGKTHTKKCIEENFLGEKNPMFGKKGNLHPRWNKQGASLGKKWYHNPYTNEVKYFIPGKEPENFYLGRKLKKGN